MAAGDLSSLLPSEASFAFDHPSGRVISFCYYCFLWLCVLILQAARGLKVASIMMRRGFELYAAMLPPLLRVYQANPPDIIVTDSSTFAVKSHPRPLKVLVGW